MPPYASCSPLNSLEPNLRLAMDKHCTREFLQIYAYSSHSVRDKLPPMRLGGMNGVNGRYAALWALPPP